MGTTNSGRDKALLLFKTIQASSYQTLDACGKSEFKRLQDLDAREKQAWLNSMRLDQSYEGRNEFFDAIWDRINDLLNNPHLIADILLRNMQAFGSEGVVYLETQQGVEGAVKPDGSPYSVEETVAIYPPAPGLAAGEEPPAWRSASKTRCCASRPTPNSGCATCTQSRIAIAICTSA